MAAKTQLSTLPAEVRSEIWSLALLPSPGVYRCDPSKFIFTRTVPRRRLEVEDARWLIPKRRYPTVVYLCRESRFFALGAMGKEVRENSFFYCIGQDTRPFIPEIDTFWFDDDDDGTTLHHSNVIRERGAIGSRVHAIRNLAVSAAVIQSCRRGRSVSNWDSYLSQGIGRFENLRRVDVVFGPVPMEIRYDSYKPDKDCWAAAAREQVLEEHNGQVFLTGMYDVPELRLVKEIRGSGFETTRSSAGEDQDQDPGVVEEKLDKVRADVYKAFENMARYLARHPPPRPQGQEDATTAAPGQGLGQQQHVAEVVHREKDLSEITFHAARMVETARFRGRTIRKCFSKWHFDEDDNGDGLDPLCSLPKVEKRGSKYYSALPANNSQ
jgi:hypothetical protein